MTVYQNIVVSTFYGYSKKGFRLKKKELETADNYIKLLKIAVDSPMKKVRNLSGGNQQKVAIAKWLCNNAEVLLMDDPTRGVDVGAKVEVYKLIQKMIAKGVAVVLASSDMPELLGISDNILIMKKGRVSAYVKASDCTQEYILKKAAAVGD